MKRRIISLLAAILIVLAALPGDMLAAPPPGLLPANSNFSAQEIVVGFKPDVTLPEVAQIHRQAGGSPKETIPALGAQVVTIPAGTMGQSIKRYAAHPLVAYAEPNYVAEPVGEPNDPYFYKQWGMEKVEAPAAWDVTTGSPEVLIAILDTGVDTEHPDLRDKIVDNVNFSDSDTADDVHGHGTHVAGIAAASTNNGIGVAGLGYDSSIMNVKVLSDSGPGYYSWVAAGIIWAADNGAHIINLSLGATYGSQLLEDAVDYAWSKGLVVVAAAGNNGASSPFYPAYYTNCMAVAATDSSDNLASWSNFGDWVDVAAPGDSIFSTLKDGRYGRKSGTSMASPHVAGLAALIFTTVSDDNGDGFLNDEVRSQIEATCDDIGVEGIGSGRINAARAVTGDQIEPQPDVEIVVAAEPTSVSQAGEVITHTYTVSNTGGLTLSSIVVTDNLLGNISLTTTTLAPGASTSATATYTATQADIDSGADIVNTATVTTDQGVTDSGSATVTVVQKPAVTIVEMANPTSVSQPGDVITYTYDATNTGTVTLTGIEVYDDLLGNISLATTTLAPGASSSATATYTVTQADIDLGADIENTVTIATDQGVTDSDSATVVIEIPEITGVTISPSDNSERGWPDEDVVYEFTVENIGNMPDIYDICVTSSWASSVASQTFALEAGAAATITVSHSVPEGVSPGDFDAGTLDVVSTDTGASASAGFTTTARVSVVEIEPDQQSATAAPDETVEYTCTISNTGTEDDVYNLAVSAAWDSFLSTTSVSVTAGGSVKMVISHTVPTGAAGGTSDTGILTVTSERASASATFTTTVEKEKEPTAPVIDLFQLTNRSNRVWAWVAVDWAVSHEAGNLAFVKIVIALDGQVIDSAVFYVSGYDAGDQYRWRTRGGHGNTYQITLIVTDTDGNTASKTESIYL